MKIKILSKDFELTAELESYLKTKIESIDEKLGSTAEDEERKYNFRIGKKSASKKKGNTFFAEGSIETDGKDYGAIAKAGDIKVAIDELKEELLKKIRRHKGKKEGQLRKNGRIFKDFLRKFMK